MAPRSAGCRLLGQGDHGRIRRLEDVILRAVNAALEPHGLRYPAHAVLATLRACGPIDGRGVIVELTRAGRELADAAMPDHAAVERALVAMFTDEERRTLAAMLSRMLVRNGAPGVPLPGDMQDNNAGARNPGTQQEEDR